MFSLNKKKRVIITKEAFVSSLNKSVSKTQSKVFVTL